MTTVVDGTNGITTANVSDGITDTATSTKLTVADTGVDVTGSVTCDGLTSEVTGGKFEVDANGFLVSTQKLDTLSAGGRFIGKSNRGELGHIAIEQATTSADGGYIRMSTSPSGSTTPTERMRIDSNGNMLVGKTALGTTTAGHELRASGQMIVTRDGGECLYLNRETSDGDIAVFRQDDALIGALSTTGNRFDVHCPVTDSVGVSFGGAIYPIKNSVLTDNAVDFGNASWRYDDIYATNGTIQTSDRNEKQDIEELTEAEQRVAVACKGLMRKYRWKDAVAEKGADARIHFGIIAQDLRDAFTAEGLDAHRYAMFTSNTWWETQTEVPAVVGVEAQDATYDEDGNELTPYVEGVEAKDAYTRTDTYHTLEEAPEGAVERTRLGVRYPELLAFIIAAI